MILFQSALQGTDTFNGTNVEDSCIHNEQWKQKASSPVREKGV